MDIIEQAESISNEQQKQHITKELLDMYEKFLNLSWELILVQQGVINGDIDKKLLDDDEERLEAIGKLEKAIETARARIDAE
jgi:hypothetical protein